MKALFRVVVGIGCGLVCGMPVLYLMGCVAFALGLMSATGLSLRENTHPEVFLLAAILGGLVSVPGSRRAGVIVGMCALTGVMLFVSSFAWGPGAARVILPMLVLCGPVGGGAFGFVVHSASQWASARLADMWTSALSRPSPKPASRRNHEHQTYDLDR